MDINFDPLKNFKFECIESCGMCCTFQPTLFNIEKNKYLKNKKYEYFIVGSNIKYPKKDNYSFKLQNDKGACIFLKNRRCDIYIDRPLICKIFPLKIYFTWRIQVFTNLSCRGLWTNKGVSVEEYAKKALDDIVPKSLINEKIFESRKKIKQLEKKFENIQKRIILLRKDLEPIIPLLIDTDNILKLYSYSKEFVNEKKSLDIHEIQNQLNGFEVKEDKLREIFLHTTFFLKSNSRTDWPLYVGPDLQWVPFRIEEDSILYYELSENGDLHFIGKLNFNYNIFEKLTDESIKIMKNYLKNIIQRDHFIGVILNEMNTFGGNMFLIAIRILCLYAIGLLCRAKILSNFYRKKVIDHEIIKETIIFMDGEIITADSIGSSI